MVNFKNIKGLIFVFALLFCISCNQANLFNQYSANKNPQLVNVLIEISAGTSKKWELSKTSGKLEIEYKDGKPRVIKYLPYPFNYGIIPKTLSLKNEGGDGDPLDAIVIGDSIKNGQVVSGKVIGALKILDDGEQDDKIITLSKKSPLYFVNSINQLEQEFPGMLQIIEVWFKNYKSKDRIKIQGFIDYKEAQSIINKSSFD